MSITVKFFASLREQVGQDRIEINAEAMQANDIRTVSDVWEQATGIEMPANTLAAVNHDYVPLDHPVECGNEVAFFPPVTGG